MIQFTRFTATNGATATKTVSLKDGKLHKRSGVLSEAIADKMSVPSIKEFAEVVKSLTPQQCLCYGITDKSSQKINSKKNLKDGEIARTDDNFYWPSGEGVLFIDCDKPNVKQEDLLSAIYEVEPKLKLVPTLITRSTSHGLVAPNEEPTKGGYHLYFVVDDARKIPEIGNAIYERLWLDGHGYHEMNSSIENPATLERCLIDKSVWQTNRIDYCADPVLRSPIIRYEQPFMISNEGNAPFATGHFKELTKSQVDGVKGAKEYSKNKVDKQVYEVREEMIEEAPEEEKDPLIKRFSLLSENRLALDHQIQLSDGSTVSIRDIEDNPEQYHQATCCDPIEPEYRDYAEVAIIYTDEGSPMVHSLAHGGATYRCEMAYEESVKVDFSKYFQAQDKAPKAKLVNKEGEEFKFGKLPEYLKSYSGAIGEIMKWSLDNSKAPSPTISLASAIQEVATVLGRDFRTSYDNYTSIYLNVVGVTGAGKEQITKNAERIRESLSVMYEKEPLSYMGQVTSEGAIFTAFEEFPRRHMIVDEYGAWLKIAYASKGDSKKKETIKMITEFFGRVSGSAKQTTYSQKGLKASERSATPDIKHPFLCFTGMTNPSDIAEAVNESMMRDGSLNRFLFFFPPEGIRKTNMTQKSPVPQSFLSWYEMINLRVQQANGGEFNRDRFDQVGNQITLNLSDQTKKAFEEMDDGYRVKRAQELNGTPFYDLMPRVAEIALRLALVFELSDHPMSTEISLNSFTKAEALVKHLKEEELRFWELHMASNDEEKYKKELYKYIHDTHNKGCNKTTIKKRFQKHTGQKVDQMLTDLINSDLIVEIKQNAPSGKGRPTILYYAQEYVG